ncbi:MAG: hypothetical protein WBM54_00910 [Woeseia sp.]
MNVRPSVWVSALVAATLVACSSDVGVKVDDFKPAQLPAGIGTQVNLLKNVVKGNKLDGELIAVTDTGLVLLLNSPLDTGAGPVRFVEAPFSLMRSARFDQVGSAGIRSEGKAVDEARLERLRLLSRFPQGLGDELKARLLATYGEAEIHLLTARTD